MLRVMALHVFTLSSLGRYPDGSAYRDARDLIAALIDSGHEVVCQTSLGAAALPLAQQWARAQGFPESMSIIGRNDGFAAEKIHGHFGGWLRSYLAKRGDLEAHVYGGTMEELGMTAGDLARLPHQVNLLLVSPESIYRVFT